MRKKLGVLFMLLGIGLVLAAMLLLLKNRQEDRFAREFSQGVMPAIKEQISQVQETTPTQTPIELLPNIPEEYLTPEDLTMTEKVIDGYGYIGYLMIPDLGLELPVMSDWDYQRMELSPCRYAGSIRGGNLVVMAHTYTSHFSQLSQLSAGAQVQFMDMDGMLWNYEVAVIDVLSDKDVEEMTAGEYDLTLFTCSTNLAYRVTVRCDLTEEI